MRHHYIPQFLLKAWAGADGKIEVFWIDPQHLRSSRLAPKSTAYEDNLNALTVSEVAGVKQQAVETDFMQHIDNLAARALQKMADTGFAELKKEDCAAWMYFIMSLPPRAPEVVSRLHAEGSKYLKASLDEKPEEYEAISESDDPPTLTEWAGQQVPGLIENFGKMSLPNFICNPEIGQKILGMKWWLWDFKGQKNHLLLADRPCIFTTGVDDPDSVIVLPISPWKAFMATKTERIANIMRQQRPKDLLVRVNESSLRQARERVYALDASPHRFICNRLIGQRERPPTS